MAGPISDSTVILPGNPSSSLDIDLGQDSFQGTNKGNISLTAITNTTDLTHLKAALTFAPDEGRLDTILRQINSNKDREKRLEEIQAEASFVRNEALDKLCRIAKDGLREDSPLGREAAEILIENCTSGSAIQKSSLCSVLAGHPEYTDTLLTLMQDPLHRQVRIQAAGVLGHMTNRDGSKRALSPEVEKKVVELGEKLSSDPRLAEPLCYALMYARTHQALEVLTAVATLPSASPFEQLTAKIVKARYEAGAQSAA